MGGYLSLAFVYYFNARGRPCNFINLITGISGRLFFTDHNLIVEYRRRAKLFARDSAVVLNCVVRRCLLATKLDANQKMRQ